jgi:two-component system, OmpR family, response regulator
MLPKTLALIDDDADFSEFLAQHLRERDVSVKVYGDSLQLLADEHAYDHDFYIVDLTLPGIDGVQLIKVLRMRTNAGLLVISGRHGSQVFADVMTAGADMHLAKPLQFEQAVLAIQAVHRRAGKTGLPELAWKLDRAANELIAPDGAHVQLSEADVTVLECFVQAHGETVNREVLREKLGMGLDGETADSLNAVIYRLRRRIERATALMVPLQSRSRVGYVFRAPLSAS